MAAKKPTSWSELMALANLPEMDREFASAQGPVTRNIPGYGEVIFTPQTSGSTPWSATYTRADGIKNNLSPNTQFEGGGDTNALWDYEPKDESFGKGLWEAFKYPALAATGAQLLGPIMGGAAAEGAGAGEALSSLGTGEGFWEAGSTGLGGVSGGGAGTVGALEGGYAGMNAASFLPDAAGALSAVGKGGASTLGSGLAKILSGEGGMQDLLGLLGPAMELYSGKEGLDRAKGLTNLVGGDVGNALEQLEGLNISPTGGSAQATAAIEGADPWGASGGRALADEQLQALMRSPGSLMTDPGYQAKMMGVDRVMAAQGQLGGGGGAVAAANASGDYYDQRLRSLAALEDMGNPVGAQQVGVSQNMLALDREKAAANLGVTKSGLGLDAARLKLAAAGGANDLAGQSLAAIGSGVTRATGGDTFMSQAAQFLNALRSSGATI